MTRYEEEYYHNIRRATNELERISESLEAINKSLEKIAKSLESEKTDKTVEDHLISGEYSFEVKCPYCGSKNVQFMYGTGLSTTNKNEFSHHYICKDCQKEFNI